MRKQVKCIFIKEDNIDIRIIERFLRDIYLAPTLKMETNKRKNE